METCAANFVLLEKASHVIRAASSPISPPNSKSKTFKNHQKMSHILSSHFLDLIFSPKIVKISLLLLMYIFGAKIQKSCQMRLFSDFQTL
mgnify:CR=1 FL=1